MNGGTETGIAHEWPTTSGIHFTDSEQTNLIEGLFALREVIELRAVYGDPEYAKYENDRSADCLRLIAKLRTHRIRSS